MEKNNSKQKVNKKRLLYLMPVILLLDQWTKYIIRTNFAVGESHPVIENIFHITYVQNTGAAFSLFRNMPIMTIAMPAVLMIICAYAIYRLYREDMIFPMICAELIFAGGLGNMVDRIAQGFVVDMIDFRVFPVFNVADIGVTCGCFLLMIWAIWSERKESKAGQAEESDGQ